MGVIISAGIPGFTADYAVVTEYLEVQMQKRFRQISKGRIRPSSFANMKL
jgi:hypothetical protein